jgi:hypothetical protein
VVLIDWDRVRMLEMCSARKLSLGLLRPDSGVWQVENKKPRFAYCKAGHVTWKNCAKRFYLPPQFSGCGADNSVNAVSLG